MRYIILFSAALTLNACGSIPPPMVSGDNISTPHGTARTQDAYAGAQEYCARRGKGVQLVRTDCPYTCVSTFKCVD